MRYYTQILIAVLVAALIGCGGDATGPTQTSSEDGGDATLEADAGSDTDEDSDTGPDVLVDSGPDAEVDAETDAKVDAEVDAQTDADVEAPTIEGCADVDGDGYGDPDNCNQFKNPPSNYVENAADCDDSDDAINPDAIEVCNGKDNDCDGSVDEGVKDTFYADSDGDGYGDPHSTVEDCSAPSGYVSDDSDCSDNDPSINPGAAEVCDGIDNNCDTVADTGCGCTNGNTQPCGINEGTCQKGTQTCENGVWGSCEGGITPTTEICDGFDNNCDGQVDEGVENTYYADSDGDGYGDPNDTTPACSAPIGYVSDDTDCDDNNSSTYPGAPEVCNGIDDNCDGQVDEGVKDRFYYDSDDDGYGVNNNYQDLCSPSGQYRAAQSGDCDDSDTNKYPGNAEVCDGKDNDCDGSVDEGLGHQGDFEAVDNDDGNRTNDNDLVDLSQYCWVNGNVTITGSATQLFEVHTLREVLGTFRLDLSNSTGNKARFENNEVAFVDLETVTGNFEMENFVVTDLTTNQGDAVDVVGFPSLTTIGGDMIIRNAAKEANTTNPLTMDAFNALQTVGGEFQIESSDFETIVGFQSLITVNNGMWIRFNYDLDDVTNAFSSSLTVLGNGQEVQDHVIEIRFNGNGPSEIPTGACDVCTKAGETPTLYCPGGSSSGTCKVSN